MSRIQRAIINLLGQLYVLTWLASVDTRRVEFVDDDGDVGVRWRAWGSA